MDSAAEEWVSPSTTKSNCYTKKSKFPRTTHLAHYLDWSQCPLRGGTNLYQTPVRRCWPPPPLGRFRLLDPAIDDETMEEIRLTIDQDRRGPQFPQEAFHLGYRDVLLDPRKRTLRHFSDPVPYPLVTTKRADFRDPKERPQQAYNTRAVVDRHASQGIVPGVMVSAYPPVKDTSWSKDYVYEPRRAVGPEKGRRN